jgi:lipoprotein-anchoring transpeptidase ErfK/SrfK
MPLAFTSGMSNSQFRRLHVRRRTLAFVGAGAMVAALATASAVRPSFAPPGESNLRLTASLSSRTLTIQDGDSIVATYPVAVGKDDKPTPAGSFAIKKIVWNPTWTPPDEPWARGKSPQPAGARANPMKVAKLFFREPDYYIHGTGDTASLGSAASHGCLRMDPNDVAEVAKYVMEHGGQPRDESWFWRVLHFRNETKTVLLNNPVPLAVTE